MDKKELPTNLREDNLSEETKALISSLPSDNDSLGKIYKYQACWYYPNVLQGVLDFQKSFKPQDTDVILASFPKSGTTWLKALTIALFERSKNSSSLESDNPHVLVPFLEFALDTERSPRLFSTHMPLNTLQEGLKDSPCKIVYVCRNLKDVLISLWFFLNSNKGGHWSDQSENVNGVENCTLEAMFESLCSGVMVCGPFWEIILSYWRGSLADPKHVLFMMYEELKAEPHGQIKKLAEFLGCPFTKEEEDSGAVDKILQLCSLSNLSSLEVNKTGKSRHGISFNSFFRKGDVGDSKNHLTLEMENKIDMIVKEKLKGSGLNF